MGPLPVALDMVSNIVMYSIAEGIPLMQSVTPFFGEPYSYEYKRNTDVVGDLAAKEEARNMISESPVTEWMPVSFDPEGNTVVESVKNEIQESVPSEKV